MIKKFVTPLHAPPHKGMKKPSLKNAFDELAFNFCQVCLQFQCVTHLAPNMDNAWAFNRTRKPTVFVDIEANYILSDDVNQNFIYLRRWARDYLEAEASMEYLQSFKCATNGLTNRNQDCIKKVGPLM